ncbi:hypothetical protein T10_12939 [Trichinella papuae]|uniref:Uncharacterized protein n=1 Tax=Trichinella papuae TaxID=268474 RepID=A0A0V1N7L2_9BILA|nr:hypothetical protein T10_12939 [Trichinella papuae]
MRKDPKYTDLGTIGSIAPEEDPICPELLPVYYIYSPLQRVNYYLTDELLLKVQLSEGYENKGIISYAEPGFGACDAFTRIYEFYSPYSGVIQFADLEWAEKFMRGHHGYTYQGPNVPQQQPSATVSWLEDQLGLSSSAFVNSGIQQASSASRDCYIPT